MIIVHCPVCQMEVDTRIAPAISEYRGFTYHFCSAGCKSIFDHDSEKYAWKHAAQFSEDYTKEERGKSED